MAKKKYPSIRDLDEFTQRRFPELGVRLSGLRYQTQLIAAELWLGRMAKAFDDDELAILNAMGFLCPLDLDYLAAAGRPVGPWPKESTSEQVAS